MEEDNVDDVGKETSCPVQKTFAIEHLLEKILLPVLEYNRNKVYLHGTRFCQGDLKSFLNLRLVSKQFNVGVSSSVRKEFKTIETSADSTQAYCNNFLIGNVPGRWDFMETAKAMDLQFVEFFAWLVKTFRPTVEEFKALHVGVLRACKLPQEWIQTINVYYSVLNDCNVCTRVIQKCRKSLGRLSLRSLEASFAEQSIHYNTLVFETFFLFDAACACTVEIEGRLQFNSEEFIRKLGGIKCDNAIFLLPSITDHHTRNSVPQPLEIIQLILKIWEVKSAAFVLQDFCVNLHRTYNYEEFDYQKHVTEYQIAGKLDRDLQYDFLPVIELHMKKTHNIERCLSDLSLNSLMETNEDQDVLHQGRIAFNMFNSNKCGFISHAAINVSEVIEYSKWLKTEVRKIMRCIWGSRHNQLEVTGKIVFWIMLISKIDHNFVTAWKDHAPAMFAADFNKLLVTMNTKEVFENAGGHHIVNYSFPLHKKKHGRSFYCSLFDPVRHNTTHIRFVEDGYVQDEL